jgi:excisionase family DNA binding protein
MSDTAQTLPRLATAEELSSQMKNVSRHRLYELCRRGEIPHVRIGRSIRFDPTAVRRWIENGGTRTGDDG